jgi:hypothetical protein
MMNHVVAVGDMVEVVEELDEEEGSVATLIIPIAACLPAIAPTSQTTQCTRNVLSLPRRRRVEIDPTL